MKTLVGLLLLVLGSASHIHAQGTVTFGNNTSTRVFSSDGITAIPGTAGYRAELMYAPDGTSLDFFEAVAVRLGADTGIGTPTAGLYSGGTRTGPTTTPGGFALFQVRVWNQAAGQDWRSAWFNHNYGVGESAIMRIDTGDPTTIPPGTPTPLVGNGLTTIIVCPPGCPEPSTIALGAAGVAALLMFRRRQRK